MNERFTIEPSGHSAGERMQAIFDKHGENSLCTWVISSVREGDNCNRVYPFPYAFFGTVLPHVEVFILNTPRYNNACRRYIDAIEAHNVVAVTESISANKCLIIGTFFTIDSAGLLLERRCRARRERHDEMVLAFDAAVKQRSTESVTALLERARAFLLTFDFRLMEGHKNSTIVVYKDTILLTLQVNGEVGVIYMSPGDATRPLFNLYHTTYANACEIILHVRRAYMDQQELDSIRSYYKEERDTIDFD